VSAAAEEFRVLSPTAILGYGFPVASFEAGLARDPHLIAVDAGSIDPGPYYLGSGKSFVDRASVKRDLGLILAAACERGIPFVMGTAGGSGARPHVEWALEIIHEIAREAGLGFDMAVVYADVPPDVVADALAAGRVRPLGPAPEITDDDIRAASRIVAQMGAEPVTAALDGGADVVVCGRAYDPVAFAAPAVRAGFDEGLALHMGKILECAAIAATPGSGRDCVLGTLRADHFELEALSPARSFTRVSTAAHTLYEKSDPYHLPGPGGALDLSETRFEETGDGRVRVSGTAFEPSERYAVKLEGVRPAGFRTISIAGVRDPGLIGQVDAVLDEVRDEVARGPGADLDGYELLFHVYGRDGVMGGLEPRRDAPAHELGLVIEAVAPTQAAADAVCGYARSTLLHFGYPGRVSTAGNLALLYSPSDIPCGEIFRFAIHHLMEVDDPCGLFGMQAEEVRP